MSDRGLAMLSETSRKFLTDQAEYLDERLADAINRVEKSRKRLVAEEASLARITRERDDFRADLAE
jgi:hypothetical protein